MEPGTGGRQEPVLVRQLPVKRLTLADGSERMVVSVYDLVLANYGLDRGLDDGHSANNYNDVKAYTPAWGEQITGVPRRHIETIAREFAETAHKTHGRSMIILGAGVNHWYHMDMNYRGMINMLVFCGCVGQTGGGWAHYVGQEKLRPQTGWLPLAFALDWNRPPRQMNSTSFFYNHASQWRYEKLTAQELLSPLADPAKFSGHLIDFNVHAERMGWLPSAPQLNLNPLSVKASADKAGLSAADYTVQALKSGAIRFACEQPDSGHNHPRNLFVWRSRAKRWVPAKELSLKRWNGSPPRLRASSICWSRLISVCPAESKHQPTARPRSLIDGKRMDKVIWGPNWEELLGGEFEKRARDRTQLCRHLPKWRYL